MAVTVLDPLNHLDFLQRTLSCFKFVCLRLQMVQKLGQPYFVLEWGGHCQFLSLNHMVVVLCRMVKVVLNKQRHVVLCVSSQCEANGFHHYRLTKIGSVVSGRSRKGKSGNGPPIQFGYRLCPLQQRNKREILGNIKFGPLAECLHWCGPPSRMSWSASVCGHNS